MDKIYYKYLIAIFFMAVMACDNSEVAKYDYRHPIPYSPEVYVCYRSPQPPSMDGLLNEKAWENASWTRSFVDIEGNLKPIPEFDTRAKMMWDDEYFYIAAKLKDDHIWATLKQRDTIIFHNNDFEVFIDPDGDTHNYIELELNALNTIWDLILDRPYREDRLPKVRADWNIENLQTAVHIEGTNNDASDIDQFWTIEMAIPLNSIIEFSTPKENPKHGEQWRVNFSRVAWHVDIINNRYVKRKDPVTNKVPRSPQENWVWSASGRVNMHQPETWGYVQFSDNVVGEKQEAFELKEEEKIKWALRQLYFQQRACKRESSTYSSNSSLFTIPGVVIDDYQFLPKIVADSVQFTITAPGLNDKGDWRIRQDGKIWFESSM